LIACIVGVLLVILSDFAGFYNYGGYYGYIYFSLETPITFVLILIVAIGLAVGAYVSYLGMQGQHTPELVRNAVISVSISLGLVIVGALIFVVAILSDEPSDWWFETGFYGGLASSAIALFFLKKAKSTM
jgi:hypothetical protein